MSRELSPRAVRRLLEVAAPLGERPELAGVDTRRYEVGRELGRGGMGIVYEAFDRELERPVALKVLGRAAGASPEARQRFVREAKAAARLAHPHIASVYDATSEAITMQRIEGETLAERPIRAPRELVGLLRDAALAIHFAHSEGVVHRDLKPANLMVEPGERPHVFVMDFGLAKELALDAAHSHSGSVLGTPEFMAPEQAAGRSGEVGPATDVYGLGATLFACLADRAPFEEKDVVQLLRAIAEEDAPRLSSLVPSIDRDLETIVAKCLAKPPGARYGSALALAGDLDRWLRGEPILARPPSLVYRLTRFVSRRQGAILAAGGAGLVAVLIALPLVLDARSRRLDSERRRELAERVFVLSEGVQASLREARELRSLGLGLQPQAHVILEDAVERCRVFLAETEVAHVWSFLARLLAEQGRPEEALAAFDRAAELDDGVETLSYRRGLVLAQLYRDGVPLLGEAPPAELETWRARGVRDLELALRTQPESPTTEWIYASAQLAWLSGELELAISRNREVLERDATHQDAHLSLSSLYLLSGSEELGMYHAVVAADLLRGLRRAYVGGSAAVEFTGAGAGLELLPVEGLRELLVDFNVLLLREPSDAHTVGLRGQARMRQALRDAGQGERDSARGTLRLALADFEAALVLRPDLAAARVDRGVCRVQLARLLSRAGASAEAAGELERARADYDAALRDRPGLVVALFDRALLHAFRADLARVAMRSDDSARSREDARRDVARALTLAGPEHPWRERFDALRSELD